MNIENDIEKLEKKIDDNAIKIIENADRIQRNSYALEILNGYKTDNRRFFTILLVVLSMWFITIGYLVYTLRSIEVVEETTQEVTQDNESGSNNYIGNDGVINNGKANN